ncbi:hypothetical protein KUCAC02_023589 [Chaenocephalus aceratus]|nr:hypothetical protein KUCAC02_035928 [Chaenocephalus aceratus]KAI4798095.1 hypothetical protein KUCAC02_023589 [Chaenocephalus aceratus]
MEHSVLDPSWDDDGIDIFELNDAQHSVAGSDSSALDVQERIDVTQQVFMQVFQDEVGKMRSLISSISQEWKKELQDLQEQVTQKIDVRFGERWSQVQEELAVYLAGREATLDQRQEEPCSQTPPPAGAVAPPPSPPSSPSPSSPASPQAVRTSPGSQTPSPMVQRTEAKSLEELDADLAEALRPHYSENITPLEKLSSLQRAFFLWKLDVMQIKDTKDLNQKATVIAIDGEEKGIWLPDWRPKETTCLQAYLGERIKSALRKRRRSDQLKCDLHTKFRRFFNPDQD